MQIVFVKLKFLKYRFENLYKNILKIFLDFLIFIFIISCFLFFFRDIIKCTI